MLRPKDTHLTQGIPKLRLFGSAYPLDLAEIDLTNIYNTAVREVCEGLGDLIRPFSKKMHKHKPQTL